MAETNGFAGLRRCVHRVQSVAFGDTPGLNGGKLVASQQQLQDLLAGPALASTRLSWARPGESVRIVKILDSLEPRTKAAGGGGIFPGFLGPALPQGTGETHVLRGVAVVVAGRLPRAQEGMVQMNGPAAELSFLGGTNNLVIEFEPAEDAGWPEVDQALRLGAMRVAVALADLALEAEPDAVEEIAPLSAAAGSSLPRVGAIVNLQTQGAFKDVFVYGRTMANSMPTAIDPNELDDGAVVSGQYGHPGLKNPTFVHQNNPVVAALRERNGRDLVFGGVILSPEPVDQTLKELTSAHAARLARQMGLDAAVVTKEGGGNADSDISLKVDALEAMGLVGVGIFAEMSGPDGTGPPVVGPPTTATAMISTGNYDERIALDAVDRALGGEVVDLNGLDATAEMTLPVAAIYGSLSPIGWGRLTCTAEATA
ncbi:MAG TPA: glycine/sarcosine/betaine reductase component B subunit [Actinomycetota bacterium]|nr:glycine/sarcosine/betaine reductase component B subunit [Actinomycetota bacterium]